MGQVAGEADGVVYASHDLAPGLKMFECKPFRAVLSIPGCAKRWKESQTATGAAGDAYAACRGCPIGAAHAGEEAVSYSALYGSMICPRCRNGTTRMIKGERCISCYNRQRELRSGRNARGNVPVKLQLRPVRYRESVDGRTRIISAPDVVDLMEPIVHTLRTVKGAPIFAFAGHEPRQGRLF